MFVNPKKLKFSSKQTVRIQELSKNVTKIYEGKLYADKSITKPKFFSPGEIETASSKSFIPV